MKSVIFPEADIQSLLADRKTMFRVPMKPQPPVNANYYLKGTEDLAGHFKFVDKDDPFRAALTDWIKSPYLPGETIYVKETFGLIDLRTGSSIIAGPPPKGDDWNDFEIVYKTSMSDFEESFNYKWFSPIFLPKNQSRFKLKILNVRAEQVQRITEEDCFMEGIEDICKVNPIAAATWSPIPDFVFNWDNRFCKSEYQWANNPWVWVNEFVRVKG